jgi:putative membrane protein
VAGFFIRFLIAAFALALAGAVVPGIHLEEPRQILIAALLLGVVNAVIRPVFVLLTLPITILTLGLFLVVVNALMLALVAAIVEGFRIDGALPALLGALIVSIVSTLASWTIGPSGRIDVWARRG